MGDFRGKSGKWTEEDSSAVGEVINEAFQQDVDAAASSSDTRLMDLSHKKAKPQTTSERTTRLPRNAPEVKLETTTDQLFSGIHPLLPGSEPPVKVVLKRSKSDFTKLKSSQDVSIDLALSIYIYMGFSDGGGLGAQGSFLHACC